MALIVSGSCSGSMPAGTASTGPLSEKPSRTPSLERRLQRLAFAGAEPGVEAAIR